MPHILKTIENEIEKHRDVVDASKKDYLVDSDWSGINNAIVKIFHPWAAYFDGSLNKYYFFIPFIIGNIYIRFSNPNLPMDTGYPAAVTDDNWEGLPNDLGTNKIVAILYDSKNSSAYFFLDNETHIKYSSSADKVDRGYPRAIDNSTWPGLKEDMKSNIIVGAFYDKDSEKDYFFLNNGEYIVYNTVSDAVEPGFPKKI